MCPPSSISPSPTLSPDARAMAAAFFSITLRIPPGEHTYKFLVDGVWTTDASSVHPVHTTDDGLRHHYLVVPPATSAGPRNRTGIVAATEDRDRERAPARLPSVHVARLGDGNDPRATSVFRSASASAVPGFRQGTSSSVSLQDTVRRKVDVAPRGSSFNAPPAVGSISHTATVNRKSLLLRVGSGWMKRFSSRGDGVPGELEGRDSFDDRSGSGFFRARDRSGLFPSASDPNVGGHRESDKENSFKRVPHAWGFTPERGSSRRGPLRGSTRNTAVKVNVSRPTKVDEPKDVDEVNRQADNWRQMARHLQDDLCDPTGARELFTKAIHHREKHGLWCTSQNAQVHVDLARNLSKANLMKDSEFHLRIALRIYNHIEAGQEHIADLLLYVGVVVDRQRRRAEAEELYRKALGIYKQHRVDGNNVEIAVKNLSLNLRKQNRETEIDGVRREFLGIKGSSVIV